MVDSMSEHGGYLQGPDGEKLPLLEKKPCPADPALNAANGLGTGQPSHGLGRRDFQTLFAMLMVQAQAIDHLADSVSHLAQSIASEGESEDFAPTTYLNGKSVL